MIYCLRHYVEFEALCVVFAALDFLSFRRLQVGNSCLAIPPCLSGKKVGRREDLLNIEVAGWGRIRQRDRGVGLALLLQKILQDRFGVDPDEFFPQDAIQ